MPWAQFLREFEKHRNFADCGVMCKGAIPVPIPKNKEQVADCLQALGWRLSKNDEDRLGALGVTNVWDWNLIKHFQNWWWQQG
jgi:diketogulonate reductase-like aldo/keto reductase